MHLVTTVSKTGAKTRRSSVSDVSPDSSRGSPKIASTIGILLENFTLLGIGFSHFSKNCHCLVQISIAIFKAGDLETACNSVLQYLCCDPAGWPLAWAEGQVHLVVLWCWIEFPHLITVTVINMKLNRLPFTKINRLLTHCCRVQAGTKLYPFYCTATNEPINQWLRLRLLGHRPWRSFGWWWGIAYRVEKVGWK